MLGGGAGREIANWVVKGKSDLDLFAWDVRYVMPLRLASNI